MRKTCTQAKDGETSFQDEVVSIVMSAVCASRRERIDRENRKACIERYEISGLEKQFRMKLFVAICMLGVSERPNRRHLPSVGGRFTDLKSEN